MGQNDLDEPMLQHLLALGHLSSSVGHSVINAFSAIVSNAEILRLTAETDEPADAVATAETIVNTAVEASGMARSLIDFTRSFTAAGPEPVDLERLAEEVLAAERQQAAAHISWDFQRGSVPPIRGQAEHLRLMLRHLIANSREAIPEAGGTITLATSRDARGWILLEVRDTGAGMSAEVLSRATEPFFTTKPDRLGIGLTIANGIWRRHRGTLAVRSRAGEGSQVRLGVEP